MLITLMITMLSLLPFTHWLFSHLLLPRVLLTDSFAAYTTVPLKCTTVMLLSVLKNAVVFLHVSDGVYEVEVTEIEF